MGLKRDRHDDHYKREHVSPFALSQECELERPGAAWSGPAAYDRGPVWRPPGRGHPRDQARRVVTQTVDTARSEPLRRDHQQGHLTERPETLARLERVAVRTPERMAAFGDLPLPVGRADLPSPAARERYARPLSRERERADARRSGEGSLVLAHRVGSRRLVYAATAAVAALGVSPGMTVGQAQAMLPGLLVHEADPEGDAAALTRLAHWAARHVSPLAAPAPPDGILLDATGLSHLFGGESALLARLEARMARVGVAAVAAVAGTPGAAHAVARFGGGGVVPPGGDAAALTLLPVAALRLDPDTLDALARVGVTTVADLAALPRPPAARRFGAATLLQLDRALGTAPEPIDPVAPPPKLVARLLFLEPLTTAEPLAEATRRLAADLAQRLRLGGLGTKRVLLAFTRVDGRVERVAAGAAVPTRDPEHLARLLLPRLESVDPGFGVERATLTAALIERLAPAQLGTDPAPDLAELVDRLANRPEAARVCKLQAVERDWPERSVTPAPALAEAVAPWPDLPRPPRLLPRPEPVDAVAMLPDHPPARFTWRGRAHRVARADGPERLPGEWWRDPAEAHAVRDYFQVEDTAGARFWLFREGDGEHPETGPMRWWLHGVFG